MHTIPSVSSLAAVEATRPPESGTALSWAFGEVWQEVFHESTA